MNVAIFGGGVFSRQTKRVLEELYNLEFRQQGREEITVVAYVDVQPQGGEGGENIDDLAVISPIQFQAFYRKKLITALIIPRETYNGQTTFISYLLMLGINLNDVYLMGRIEEDGISRLIEPFLMAKYLPYLEFHIADHCNLNCKGCEHYSGLVKKPKFPNPARFRRDMEQLHKFIDDIGTIRILGGEPLLNRDINFYVRLSRQLYPKAQLIVVTNALLLPSMPDDFFETLRQNNASIHISFYKPLVGRIDAIRELLQSKSVGFGIGPLAEQFTVKQTLRRHDHPWEMFLRCFQAHCRNLYEGKLAACFLPFTTKYFNEYFGKKLPEDGAIDLYDENLTTPQLKSRLLQPFERCRYCTPPVPIDWTTIKNPSVLSDWINDEIE